MAREDAGGGRGGAARRGPGGRGGVRVVVAGGGFAGLYAALYLSRAELREEGLEVTLVSRSNYFTFTPLLAEVVGGALGREHVTVPYRILAGRRGFRFLKATVKGVDPRRRRVSTTAGELAYDLLILALGSTSRYFGNEALARRSQPFAGVDDAVAIHDRVIEHAERATRDPDPVRRRRLLTFAVAGAGPAGVEAASEIWHLLDTVLPRYYDFRAPARVVIYEGSDRILRGWDEGLVREGLAELRRRGIDVRLGVRVHGYEGGVVDAEGPDGDESVEAGTLIWTAGTSPATGPLRDSGLPLGERGHLALDPCLRVEGHENIFGAGDAASLVSPRTGVPYPPVAPIAISQGIRAAGNVENAVAGRAPEAYEAHHAGKIVSLGGGVAFVDLLGWKVTGPLAWAIYRAAYLSKLVGAKNKIRAGVTLLLNRFFERDLTGP